MILRRQNPVLENMYSGRYQINKKIYICIEYRILEAVCPLLLSASHLSYLFLLSRFLPCARKTMFFALYYLCAISVLSLLSLCYRWSVMLGGVVGSVLSLCYLCAIDGLSCWGMFFALRYLCAISVLFLINLCRYIAQTGRRSYPP